MRLFEQIRQAALCHRRAGPGDEVAVPDLFGSCSSVEHRVGAVVLGEFGVRLSFGLAEAEDAFEEVDLNLHRAFVELPGHNSEGAESKGMHGILHGQCMRFRGGLGPEYDQSGGRIGVVFIQEWASDKDLLAASMSASHCLCSGTAPSMSSGREVSTRSVKQAK